MNKEIDELTDSRVEVLLEQGICQLPNLLDEKTVEDYRKICDTSMKKYIRMGGKVRSGSVYINNPFNYSRSFLSLISKEEICMPIERAIGDNVSLINSGLVNVMKYGGSDLEHVGGDWHTDSRYIQRGKRRLPHGFAYLVFVCLDNWSMNREAATKYIPQSHLFIDRPERDLDESSYDIKRIEGKAGDAFIIDAGTWHKAGQGTNMSRWGVVLYYGPWYIKPYFDYWSMFSLEEIKAMSSRQVQLMHLNSKPPVDDFTRMNTLVDDKTFRNEVSDKYSNNKRVFYG